MFGIKIDTGKRIFGFDLLRAFAIFCVLHGHGRHLLNGTLLAGFPWFKLPHGVDIFFVISGFLIGLRFITYTEKTGGKPAFNNTLDFWKRSAFRILPAYFFILLLHFILVKTQILDGEINLPGLILFVTFTQNLFYPFTGFFWESWSLAVQEWFYFLFPLLLFFYSRFYHAKWGVLLISLFFILAPLAYRYGISHASYDSFWWDACFRKVVASRIDSIFFGVLAAWVRTYFPTIWNKYAVYGFILGVLLFFVSRNIIPVELNTLYTNVFYLSLGPLSIAFIFPLFDKIKKGKTPAAKIIAYISVLSYAMYLLNLLIVQIIDKHFSSILTSYQSLKYILFWLVCLVAAYLLYILVERPFNSVGNQLFGSAKRT